MNLLALSRLTAALSEASLQDLAKEAEPAPEQPIVIDPASRAGVPHGTQGRLLRPALGGVGLKKVEGPRAYGPRLSKPGT